MACCFRAGAGRLLSGKVSRASVNVTAVSSSSPSLAMLLELTLLPDDDSAQDAPRILGLAVPRTPAD